MKLIILGFALAFCGCQKKMTEKAAVAKPNIVVYQLKKQSDLSFVPVTLDEQKQNIVSYPAPKDLARMKAAEVFQNWVIDQRGVNPNTVFVDVSIQEYISKNELPDLAVWQGLIHEKNPFQVFYQCPGTLDIEDIIKIISKKKWKKCTCLISEK